MEKSELITAYEQRGSVPSDARTREAWRGHAVRSINELLAKPKLTDEDACDMSKLEKIYGDCDHAEDMEKEPVRRLHQTGSPNIIVGRPTAGARGKDLFEKTSDPFNGDYNDYFRSLIFKKSDPRLFEVRTSSGLTGAGGGFDSPSELSTLIYDSGTENSGILRRVLALVMNAGELNKVAYDGEDRSGGTYAGYRGEWLGELQASTGSDVVLRNILLVARKVAIYSGISMELQQDSLSLASDIINLLGRALRNELEFVVLRGNGISQPLGLLQSGSRITVGRATAASVTYPDLVNMVVRLAPQFRQGAIWVINPEALQPIHLMIDPASSYIYTGSAGNVAGAPGPSLLGFPIYLCEAASALGSEGDVILADFGQYLFGTRETLTYEVSNAPLWSQAVTSFRMIGRFAGCPALDSAIKPRYGSNTLSWAVTLGS